MELRDNKRKGWDVKGSKIRDEMGFIDATGEGECREMIEISVGAGCCSKGMLGKCKQWT